MKKFSELSKSGQAYRIQKHQQELEARGTQEQLATVVNAPKVYHLENGDKSVSFRLALYTPGQKDSFKTMSAYVKAGKDAYEEFLTSIKVGDRVAVEYKLNDKGYGNIYNLFPRPRKTQAQA